jgi:transposase
LRHPASISRKIRSGGDPRKPAAPIEASSGPKVRHRLNPNGNRHLNHAIHVAALGQISHETAGRAYYLAKQTEGKSRKEAMRCLKRRISDAVYRQLRADLTR